MKRFLQDFQVVEVNDADLQHPFKGVKVVTQCGKVETVVNDLNDTKALWHDYVPNIVPRGAS